MVYSKHTDELIKELNSLIVQAQETIADTKKYQEADVQAAAFYGQFWELVAGRTENMSEALHEILRRVEMITQATDEISTHFLLVKAIDDTAFEANVTAFHVGLMISRAMPEHKAVFQPLCKRYDSLAQSTQMKSRKMADFLNELFGLILQDMRKQAKQRIQSAVEAGRAAAENLSNPALPYGYIADEIMAIVKELDSLTLEDVTLSFLTDAASTLETIHFAAYTDILRAPQHQLLFDGISDFKGKLNKTVRFFQDLKEDGLRTLAEMENRSKCNTAEKQIYTDLAMQEGIVLFCLKGEIQKLGDTHLDTEQKAAFRTVCGKIGEAIKVSRSLASEEEKNKVAELLHEAYDGLTKEAERLGPYGGAIQYLAEKVKTPLKYLPKEK